MIHVFMICNCINNDDTHNNIFNVIVDNQVESTFGKVMLSNGATPVAIKSGLILLSAWVGAAYAN